MKSYIKKSSRNLLLLFLLFILLIGFYIRTPGILSQNILFLFDNARDLLFVKKIIIDHHPILIGPSSGGLQGYFHGVWWYYLLVIPFFIGLGNPVYFTLFMAIASTFSILLASIIIYKITNSYIGAIFTSILFTFSAFSIDTSRFIWNPYPIVWLMPIYFALLFLLSRQKKIALPLISLLTGFIFSFEAIYGIPLVLSLIIFTFFELIKKNNWLQKFKTILVSMILFNIAFMPSLFFDIRHDFLITSSIIKTITTGGDNITHNDKDRPLEISERIIPRLQDLFTYTINSVSKNTIINIIIFIFSIFGFILLIKYRCKEDLFLMILVLTIFIFTFLVFLTLKYSVWSYYWIGNPPLYCLFTSYIIGVAVKKNKLFKNSTLILAVILLIFFSFASYLPFKIWQKGLVGEGSQTLSTQLSIVDKIYSDADGKPFSVYVLTPPVYDYVYRYLFWWKGYYKYQSFPKYDKQRWTYLIIEPTPSDFEGKFFKEKVVRTKNKPSQTFIFPGNVRVEKIIIDQNENPVDHNYFPEI